MLKPSFLLTKTVPLTIYRATGQGEYVDGEWVESGTTDVVRNVNIQPFKDEELLLLPEADRSKEWYKLYCAEDLIADKPGVPSGTTADEFTWNGERYKVMKVRVYGMGTLNHWKAHAARLEISAG
ncbi:head completion protein [Pseudomonas phage vB_PsaM_M1]|nr:head completion protein [Pseudomonas phage vB_PsaM_M1]